LLITSPVPAKGLTILLTNCPVFCVPIPAKAPTVNGVAIDKAACP